MVTEHPVKLYLVVFPHDDFGTLASIDQLFG